MAQTERRMLGKRNDEYVIATRHKYNKTVKYFQIKGDKYRTTVSGDFYPFCLDKNLIIFSDNDNRTDSAYINLITDGELTISIKKGEDFYQYEYKK